MKKEVYDQHVSFTVSLRIKNKIAKEAKKQKLSQADFFRQLLKTTFSKPKQEIETPIIPE